MKRTSRATWLALVGSALVASAALAVEEKVANDTPGFGVQALCNLSGYQSQTLSVGTAIPENNAAGITTSPIQFPDDGLFIGDVVIGLDITHTWVGDLSAVVGYDETCDGTVDATAVILCRPRGTGADAPAPCGTSSGFGCSGDLDAANTLFFDDTAAAAVADGSCPTVIPAGCYSPPSQGGTPLSVFANRPKGGCWTLNVSDRAAEDTGTLVSWSVHVLSQPNSVSFGTPSGAIAPPGCATIDVNTNTSTAARGASVTIQLSPQLELCTTPAASITRGTWLDGFAFPFYSVTDLGGGKYKIDQALLGSPCGPTGGGTAFTISVQAASPPAASGTISFVTAGATDLQVTDCAAGPIPVTAASPVTIDIGGSLDPITNFVVTQVRTGNDADGTTQTRFEFTLPAGATAAEIYCAPFGNYPEYDDAAAGLLEHRINFQTPAAPTPPAWEADEGLPYDAVRGYGWTSGPLSTTARGLDPNDPRDTFAYAFNADPAAVWEITGMSPGPHQVRIVCGDPVTQGRHRVTINGVPFLANVLTNGGQYAQATQTVTVAADGKITMTLGGLDAVLPLPASHTKVNLLEISAASGGGPSGSVPPTVTAFPPDSRYSLLGSPATSPALLESSVRDYYFYVAFATNGADRSRTPAVAAQGVVNYHLGDIYSTVECGGDNIIGLQDLSFFGANYGRTGLPSGDPAACADFGPLGTTPPTVGLPLTDNNIDFQDLNLFALNYGAVSKGAATPIPAATNVIGLEPVEESGASMLRADLRMQGAGNVRAVAVRLGWNPRVVTPLQAQGGDFLDVQGGIALQPAPGSVDFALLGPRTVGLAGDGVVASVRFRRLADGDSGMQILALEARDLEGNPVAIEAAPGAGGIDSPPRVTALLGNAPNPFNPSTKISFALAHAGPVRLSIYTLDGRVVRRLVDATHAAGLHDVAWDGTDDRGGRVSSGVYYARFTSREGTSSHPIVLVK